MQIHYLHCADCVDTLPTSLGSCLLYIVHIVDNLDTFPLGWARVDTISTTMG